MTFKDFKGQSWEIAITVGTIAKVRNRLGYNMGDIRKFYEEVMIDPEKVVNVLYVICESQAEKRGISDTQFGESFDGPTYMAAASALEEEMLLFCPPRQREVLAKARTKGEAIREKMIQIANEKIENLDVQTAAQEMLSLSPTSLPG